MEWNKALNEKFYTSVKHRPIYGSDEKTVEIWLNPNGSEFLDFMKYQEEDMSRGVLFKNGNLYLMSVKVEVTEHDETIHDDILYILSKKGILKFDKFWFEDLTHINKYICIYVDKNKTIHLAVSYRQIVHNLIEKHFEEYKEALNKKNKMFKLVLN